MKSVYEKFLYLIERFIAPCAGVIAQQKYVTSIRDGFVTALPFMIIGSFLIIFIYPPFSPETDIQFARNWLAFSLKYRDQLMLPYHLTMGLMTIFISAGVGSSLGKQFNLDPVMAALLSILGFLIVAAPIKDGQISTTYLSGAGIFTALLTSIFAVRSYAFMKKHRITIRLPEQVPEGVSRSFEVLVPVLFLIVSLHPLNLLALHYSGMIVPEAIMHLLAPLISASDSLSAVLLAVLVCQFLWFAGIHGAMIVSGIMLPFWIANLSENQEALAAGHPIPHIFVQAFWDHYILIGGVGSTIPLAIMLLRSKVVHLRSIGKLGIVPSFFNINEPIMFGLPIVMNPLFIIPFITVPLINACIAYVGTKYGLIERVVSLTPWTTPGPIGASWAANWSVSPVIMSFISLIVSALIWFPFFKAYERALLLEESVSNPDTQLNNTINQAQQ